MLDMNISFKESSNVLEITESWSWKRSWEITPFSRFHCSLYINIT